jgi:hypothetical protein
MYRKPWSALTRWEQHERKMAHLVSTPMWKAARAKHEAEGLASHHEHLRKTAASAQRGVEVLRSQGGYAAMSDPNLSEEDRRGLADAAYHDYATDEVRTVGGQIIGWYRLCDALLNWPPADPAENSASPSTEGRASAPAPDDPNSLPSPQPLGDVVEREELARRLAEADGWVFDALEEGEPDRGYRYHDDYGDPTKTLYREMAQTVSSIAPQGPEEGGWRPIATAPRDGTPILAFCVHPNARLAGEDSAEWTEIVTTRWIDFNGGGWTWNGICGVHTHWQPLPTAPPPPAKGQSHE